MKYGKKNSVDIKKEHSVWVLTNEREKNIFIPQKS